MTRDDVLNKDINKGENIKIKICYNYKLNTDMRTLAAIK